MNSRPKTQPTLPYQAFMSGKAGDDATALIPAATHAELRSSPDLAIQVLRYDKGRLAQHLASVDEEWKRWRPGADVDTHLPAFVGRAATPNETTARLSAARGLVYEAFRFGARVAVMSGGKHDSGLGLIVQTAEHMAKSFERTGFPVRLEDLTLVMRDAASSAPGSGGVFVVIPFVNQEEPGDFTEVRANADQMVAWLGSGESLRLTSQVLDDRELVDMVSKRLGLGEPMATHGIFVTIPLVDPDDPNNISGVLRNAARLVELLARQGAPAWVVRRAGPGEQRCRSPSAG